MAEPPEKPPLEYEYDFEERPYPNPSPQMVEDLEAARAMNPKKPKS